MEKVPGAEGESPSDPVGSPRVVNHEGDYLDTFDTRFCRICILLALGLLGFDEATSLLLL